MKKILKQCLSVAALLLFAAHGVAQAEECATATIPKKAAKAHHARQAQKPLSEEEQLARDYRARRAAGDNRNCPCAGNRGEYCSCDSYRGDHGYYGYGYYGYEDRYGTNAGWSRGWGHSSDIPSSGYTTSYHR